MKDLKEILIKLQNIKGKEIKEVLIVTDSYQGFPIIDKLILTVIDDRGNEDILNITSANHYDIESLIIE